ncbi:alcohol dehydrogenase [Aspergillus ochraceoroseus]|uniref:Alcohol dehydrogenase n=1 Tax=Aspergillus ochraceoroseus TaxID=138278 RepID=A0A0F8V242_9EURO|nr:alcohol dehydrogenase [Aspergillus ochraceoroseus]
MTAVAIPKTQIAAVLPSGATLEARLDIRNDRPVPTPAEGEVLVKLEYSGVCHSDVHSVRGETPMLTDVAGHEGVGRVVQVGSGVDDKGWMGKRVGIRFVPTYLYILSSIWSHLLMYQGLSSVSIYLITHKKRVRLRPKPTYRIEYLVSPAAHVTKIPEELDPDTAAPLLCAGIAMYSSIMKTKTLPGDWIVLPGAGGGLGHMGVQIAVKKGLKVIAIDSGEKKKQLCLKLGATIFLDYKTDNVESEVKALTSGLGAHAVICTAQSEAAYEQSLRLLRSLGVLVCVGIPNVPFRLPASPFDMIVKGLTIVGNSAGTAREMEELMEMAVAGDVKAHIECFEFDQIDDVIQRLGRSEIDGRAVMRIPE